MVQLAGTKPQHSKMNPGAGFRIRRNSNRPERKTVDGYLDFHTPEISDLMNRLYTMNTAIKPLTNPDLRILGPACTVKCFPGDNLMVHKALDIAQPGDIVVVDTSSSLMTAVLGDTISMKARHRGIAGFVVDGLIRDLPAIQRLGDFPVFARATTPIGPLQRGPGEINYPVSCGGVVVHPGDLVIGDLDGVVIVPQDVCREILEVLVERAPAEQAYVAAVARGEFSNAWVDALLDEASVSVPTYSVDEG